MWQFNSTKKDLKYLRIVSRKESPIIISLENFEICKSLKKLVVDSEYKLLPHALKFIGDSFPNIKQLQCNDLRVGCICCDVNEVCFVCYKQFLKVCTNAFERCFESKNAFHIWMDYADCKSYYNVIINSIFEQYLISQHSYRFVIGTQKYVKVRNYLLDYGISYYIFGS